MPLTDTAIRALKPKAKRYSRTDERGLVLEVFPTGGMLWHYRYGLNGKQERVTLGRYAALSLKLARAERDKRETLVAQGQWPAVQKRLAKVRTTIDAVRDQDRHWDCVSARPRTTVAQAFPRWLSQPG
jgi:hypothetical protein